LHMDAATAAEAVPLKYGAVGLSDQEGDAADVHIERSRPSADAGFQGSLNPPVEQAAYLPPDTWNGDLPQPTGPSWVAKAWIYWGYVTAHNCFNSL